MATKTISKYNITEKEGKRTGVTLFVGTKPYNASADHPNFEAICAALEASEDQQTVIDLFDASDAVAKKFAESGSTKLEVKRGRVYHDGKVVTGGIFDKILDFHKAKVDFKPLVRFFEKIEKNPSADSRASLFDWLEAHNYTLCADGDFLAYKSVHANEYKSDQRGHAFVNGVELRHQQIPNVPGSIISMPRGEVTANVNVHCSVGLHVADYTYARDFLSGQTLLRVKINPINVVSVPRDHSLHKMRVCEYRVVQVVHGEQDDLLFEGAFLTAKLKGKAGVKFAEVTPIMEPAKVPAKGRKAPAKKSAPKRKPASAPAKKIRGAAKKAAVVKPVEEYKFPDYYEDFRRADFQQLGSQRGGLTELRWLAKEWAADDDVAIEGGISRADAPTLVRVLTAAATARAKFLGRR